MDGDSSSSRFRCDDALVLTTPRATVRQGNSMAHHGEPDELYTLRQEFYVGNYRVCFLFGVLKGDRSIVDRIA